MQGILDLINLLSGNFISLVQPPLQSKGGWTRHRKYRDIEGVGKRKFRRRDALKIRLEAPLVRILKNLTESQFMKKGKSSPKYS